MTGFEETLAAELGRRTWQGRELNAEQVKEISLCLIERGVVADPAEVERANKNWAGAVAVTRAQERAAARGEVERLKARNDLNEAAMRTATKRRISAWAELASLRDLLAEKDAEFVRMENAWRKEVDDLRGGGHGRTAIVHKDLYDELVQAMRVLKARLAAVEAVLDDEHVPWSYTEFGILCSCGSAMDSGENCLAIAPIRAALAEGGGA